MVNHILQAGSLGAFKKNLAQFMKDYFSFLMSATQSLTCINLNQP